MKSCASAFAGPWLSALEIGRQRASGAEGERLKEAASINKSLSTLGYVRVKTPARFYLHPNVMVALMKLDEIGLGLLKL